MTGAVANKIQDRIDGQRQHRTLDEVAAFAAEHRLGLRMLAEQALIHQWRQIPASLRGKFETAFDRMGGHHTYFTLHFRL